jgi:hypothetical protein
MVEMVGKRVFASAAGHSWIRLVQPRHVVGDGPPPLPELEEGARHELGGGGGGGAQGRCRAHSPAYQGAREHVDVMR